MKRITVVVVTIIGIAILALLVAGTASMVIPANDTAKAHAQAPNKSPVINVNEVGDWELVREDFIHYYAKPTNPGKPPKTETCFKLLGVKWTSLPVAYVINPTNEDGLTAQDVTTAISQAAETWDDATNSELFKNKYAIDDTVTWGNQVYKNAISFGDYSDPNVIAVTSIWYTRRGKQIVEFDILFDTDFTWGDATQNSGVMDLQNIATHELGHGVGLGDIYSDTCSEVTMYGYSGYGETKKSSLEPPDIYGLEQLYGE